MMQSFLFIVTIFLQVITPTPGPTAEALFQDLTNLQATAEASTDGIDNLLNVEDGDILIDGENYIDGDYLWYYNTFGYIKWLASSAGLSIFGPFDGVMTRLFVLFGLAFATAIYHGAMRLWGLVPNVITFIARYWIQIIVVAAISAIVYFVEKLFDFIPNFL